MTSASDARDDLIANIILAVAYVALATYAVLCYCQNRRAITPTTEREKRRNVMSTRFPLLVFVGSMFRFCYFIPNQVWGLSETPQNYEKYSGQWWSNFFHLQLQSSADVIFLYLFGLMVVCMARAYLNSVRPGFERKPLSIFQIISGLYVATKISLIFAYLFANYSVVLVIHSIASGIVCILAALAFFITSVILQRKILRPVLRLKGAYEEKRALRERNLSHEKGQEGSIKSKASTPSLQSSATGTPEVGSSFASLAEGPDLESAGLSADACTHTAHNRVSGSGSLNPSAIRRVDCELCPKSSGYGSYGATNAVTEDRRPRVESGYSSQSQSKGNILSGLYDDDDDDLDEEAKVMAAVSSLASQARRLTIVGILCTGCLLFRAGCLLYQFCLVVGDMHTMSRFPRYFWWIIIFVYYILNDVVASAIVITVLRKAVRKDKTRVQP